MSDAAAAGDGAVAEEDAALARLTAQGGRLAGTTPLVHYGDHADQVVEVYGSGRPTIVVVHGGFFRPGADRTHARPMAVHLAAALGLRVWLVEYRRVPGTPEATLTDLRAIDRLAATEGAEVCLWAGHSAGGTLALWRATADDLPPVNAVALAPVADLVGATRDRLGSNAVSDWLGGGPDDVPDRYAAIDPTPRLRRSGARAVGVCAVHGERDATVPVEQSAALAGYGVGVDVLPEAHHFDVVDPAAPAMTPVVAVMRRGCGLP